MALENLLFTAILTNNLTQVRNLLDEDVDVNISDAISRTPLHISVLNPEIFQLLIKKGANINAVNSYGDTPLHTAVDLMELEIVCMLLYYGADPNIANKENKTPFMKALMSGMEDLQGVLLDYVDNFEIKKMKENLVALAIKYRSPFVKEIVFRGGKIDQRAIDLFYYSDENFTLFKFIWVRIPSSKINQDTIGSELIYGLCQGSVFYNLGYYLDFIVENSSEYIIEALACSLSNIPLRYLFSRCYKAGCLDQLTKFICLLLQFNFKCLARDIIELYEICGYCDLFKILLHFGTDTNLRNHLMAHSNSKCSDILPTYIYFIKSDIKNLCKSKNINFIQQYSIPNMIYLVNTMAYWAHPIIFVLLNELRIELPNFLEICSELPKFPSLVELARDKTRQYIVKKFNMSKTTQYYTFIQYLNIPLECKKILSFEKPIYTINETTLNELCLLIKSV